MIAARRHWEGEAAETARPATVAECFSNDEEKRFYRLLYIGQRARLLEGEIGIGNGTPAIRGHLAAVRDLFARWGAELESSLAYRAIPIRNLVAVQFGAALATAANLQEPDGGDSAPGMTATPWGAAPGGCDAAPESGVSGPGPAGGQRGG